MNGIPGVPGVPMAGAEEAAAGCCDEVIGRPTVNPPTELALGSGDARDAMSCGDFSSWILCRIGVCCGSTAFDEPATLGGTGLIPFAGANGEWEPPGAAIDAATRAPGEACKRFGITPCIDGGQTDGWLKVG